MLGTFGTSFALVVTKPTPTTLVRAQRLRVIVPPVIFRVIVAVKNTLSFVHVVGIACGLVRCLTLHAQIIEFVDHMGQIGLLLNTMINDFLHQLHRYVGGVCLHSFRSSCR